MWRMLLAVATCVTLFVPVAVASESALDERLLNLIRRA